MADHATRKTTTDRLEEAINRLSNSQATLLDKHADLFDKYSELSGKVDTLLDHLHLRSPAREHHGSSSHFHQRNSVKLDVPRFDGRDPMGWIFKISQLFEYQNTPEEERITVAFFYLDGAALSWYQWMFRNGFITSWSGFLQALESRFAPSYYDDPKGALFKLTQRGTVNEYLTEFERLANRVIGLPPPFLLSCFVSGLTQDIRREVLALQPISLPQAMALAKLQEDKIRDRRQAPPRNHNTPSASYAPPTRKPHSTYVQRTPDEMALRREKGLCYNCEEKWSSTHRCKGRVLLFIADNPSPTSDEPISEPPLLPLPEPTPACPPDLDSTSELTPPHVSLHALSGLPSSETFRLVGIINHSPLTILIDSGSTHNFLQPRLAQFLRLKTQPTNPLNVLVGNGSVLKCDQVCHDISLLLQDHHFLVTFHLLPISGADAVLGIEWLKQFGPIITDYTAFSMKFTHMGQPIELHADVSTGPTPISAPQVKRLLQTGAASALFHLKVIPNPQPDPLLHLPHPIPAVQALLTQFHTLFQQPSSLPPPRSIVHHITLLPNTAPINVRPYRYPQFQKSEIEKQVSELLESGLIQPSMSPYSSPVLLVKKKDGTWRMCVDYRALNAATVRDRFPIPTIDELLDELGSATWFSKLDLRQGFHQILMHGPDVEKTAFRTHQGHYEYRVMPFGLCNAPSTFQAAMNTLLTPFLRKFAAVFFDDILIYSRTLASHLHHLELIFQTLLQSQYYLKKTKCLFAQKQIEYLGHVVSGQGVEPEPSKVQAMVQWPTPSSAKELRSFLGLTGFYRKFIKNYAMITAPLTSLCSKEPFEWPSEAQSAFDRLKTAMTSAPVLALPDFDEPFIIETDASDAGMGAVLMQKGHPLAFFSKQFGPRMVHASTYVRELHAIVAAVRKWRQYLLGHPFTIFTDHKSLRELMSQVIQTPEQHYYLSKLLGFDYTIQYKVGSSNAVADALSRTTPSGEFLLLSVPHLDFMRDLRNTL